MSTSARKAFVRLQEVHADHEAACDDYEDACSIDATHPTFLQIMEHYVRLGRKRPAEDTWNEVKQMRRHSRREIDRLCIREEKIFTRLYEAGYDMRAFYAENYIMPMVAKAEVDVEAIRVRKLADEHLSKVNPVEVHEGMYSTTRKTIMSASSAACADRSAACADHSDGHEAADCDILTDDGKHLLENDLPSDRVAVYSEMNDAAGVDEAVEIVDTGARWYKSFRIPPDLRDTLHAHQHDCVLFILENLLHNRGTIVAHAMGLGKTLSVLASYFIYATRFKTARGIVACPKGMVQPWVDEVRRWESMIGIDCHAIFSSDAVNGKVCTWQQQGGFLVIGHDLYRKCLTGGLIPSADPLVLIVDEAHLLLKSASTKMYRAIDAMSAKRRILLTGTAMQNNLVEFYRMVNLCAPGLLGPSVTEFNKVYATPIQAGMMKDSSKKERALSDRLVWIMRTQCEEHLMHSHSADILHQTLKPKVELRILHPGVQRHAINADDEDTDAVLQARHQVAVDCRKVKIRLVIQLIDAIRTRCPSDGIVVFSSYTETLVQLAELRAGSVYCGDTSVSKRAEYKAEFDNEAGSVIYVSTKAGGVGINLSAGNRVIIVDASWNPADDNQAVARCFRMGQTKPVFVYRLVANETLEVGLYHRLVQKQALAANVLNAKDMPRVYNKGDLDVRHHKRAQMEERISRTDLAQVDPCLLDVDGGELCLAVHDHSKLFLETRTDLTECQREESKNELHLLRRTATRRAIAPDGSVHIVKQDVCFFSTPFEHLLVPPYAPVLEKSRLCAADLAALHDPSLFTTVDKATANCVQPCISYSSADTIYIRLGPYFRQDACERTNYHFELSFRQTKTANGDRIDEPLDSAMHDAHSAKDRRVVCKNLAPGAYVCSSRVVNTVNEDEHSEWSPESAEFAVA